MNREETIKAIQERHAVRAYDDHPIDADVLAQLQACIDECNAEGSLHIQLVTDEPHAFGGSRAHYGKFSGVTNYLALVGPKDAEERIGYFGEKVVLLAQHLGLNTCWVALTFSKVKDAYEVAPGEKLHLVVSLGHGTTQGIAHTQKAPQDVASYDGEIPEWFANGVAAALLAPTAMNQQKFRFEGAGSTVTAKPGLGFYTKADLGIAKYHFEVAAGPENFTWA